MLKVFRNKRAQSTAEYAVVLALVVGAVVAMQVYVRRGVQGRIKNVVDHVGSSGTVGNTTFNFTAEQYEPYYLASEASTVRTSLQNETLGLQSEVARASTEATSQARMQVTGWNTTDVATAPTAPANLTAAPLPAMPTVGEINSTN